MHTVDKETFTYWITHPYDLGQGDQSRLEYLVENFPYCQLGHALLAKSASQSERVATEVIPRAAVYALNRGALRRLVENEFEWSGSLLNRLTELPYGPSSTRQGVTPYGREKPISLIRFESQFTSTEDNAVEAPSPETNFLPVDDSVIAEKVIEEGLTHKRLKAVPYPAIELIPRPEKRPDERRKQQEIIENFIKNDPRIGPIRANTAEPVEVEDLSARQPVPSFDGLATESFALILIKQGKIAKAINIYEKLILKFPEKKDYFAKKIEELDRK
ncbi:hypothetical protein HNQ92_001206 [Rhabdobacter roseus]|uniref:Tetratricopeptide repeat protein n=1 Tax=Rhabdobacter roseus TaxID=1655419 RepID=A0A840TSV0_9BACT|nr:hypothetical protein [Rhabdobacter roseus]MBB5283080.1 hypothetical protein [Rhabdobacter roseus]